MSASKLVIDREAAVGSLPRPLRYRGLESEGGKFVGLRYRALVRGSGTGLELFLVRASVGAGVFLNADLLVPAP